MLRCMLVVALLMLGGTPSAMGQSKETLQNQILVLEGILAREPDPAAKEGLQRQIDSVKEQMGRAVSQPTQAQHAPRYEAPALDYRSDRHYDPRYVAHPHHNNYGRGYGYGNQQFGAPIRFNNNGFGMGGLNVGPNGVSRRGTFNQPGFWISRAGNVGIGNLRFPIR